MDALLFLLIFFLHFRTFYCFETHVEDVVFRTCNDLETFSKQIKVKLLNKYGSPNVSIHVGFGDIQEGR